MDPRILSAVVIGLVLMAFGGFYFALSPRSGDAILLPPKAAPSPSAAASAVIPRPAVPPPMATPVSVEAELARSEHAELQTLLKQNFNGEYTELIAVAVRRRNEGVSEAVFGQELAERVQEVMRGKLKFGVWASMAFVATPRSLASWPYEPNASHCAAIHSSSMRLLSSSKRQASAR